MSEEMKYKETNVVEKVVNEDLGIAIKHYNMSLEFADGREPMKKTLLAVTMGGKKVDGIAIPNSPWFISELKTFCDDVLAKKYSQKKAKGA